MRSLTRGIDIFHNWSLWILEFPPSLMLQRSSKDSVIVIAYMYSRSVYTIEINTKIE